MAASPIRPWVSSVERRGEDDEVRLREQLRQLLRREDPVQHQRPEVRLVAGAVGRVGARLRAPPRGHDPAPERRRQRPHGAPDGPQAHDAHGDVAQLAGLEGLPGALRLELQQRRQAPRARPGS